MTSIRVSETIEYLKKNIRILGQEEIDLFSEMDNSGTINNVLIGIEREVYTVMLLDENQLLYQLIYICFKDGKPTGFLIKLNARLENRDDILSCFSKFISEKYSHIDIINAYNTYQKYTRSMLEKLQIYTYTNHEIEKYRGRGVELIIPFSHREPIYLMFIKRHNIYRQFFETTNLSQSDLFPCFVYLILHNNGNVKIGRSKNPIAREKTLQSEDPELSLLAYWNCPSAIEKELHLKFKTKRKRGEWFNLQPEDLKNIKEYLSVYKCYIV